MITIPSDTTVLTNENYEVLIAILEEMRGCLSNDLEMEDLSDRAGDVLSRDYRRLRIIQEQLALTMETFKYSLSVYIPPVIRLSCSPTNLYNFTTPMLISYISYYIKYTTTLSNFMCIFYGISVLSTAHLMPINSPHIISPLLL